MTRAGARGETARRMDAARRLPEAGHGGSLAALRRAMAPPSVPVERGGERSMVVLRPRDPEGLGATEERLDTASRLAWPEGLTPRRVEMFLPRFEVRWGGGDLAPAR